MIMSYLKHVMFETLKTTTTFNRDAYSSEHVVQAQLSYKLCAHLSMAFYTCLSHDL